MWVYAGTQGSYKQNSVHFTRILRQKMEGYLCEVFNRVTQGVRSVQSCFTSPCMTVVGLETM